MRTCAFDICPPLRTNVFLCIHRPSAGAELSSQSGNTFEGLSSQRVSPLTTTVHTGTGWMTSDSVTVWAHPLTSFVCPVPRAGAELASQSGNNFEGLRMYLRSLATAAYQQKTAAVDDIERGLMQEAQKFFVLTQTDNLWKEHLQVDTGWVLGAGWGGVGWGGGKDTAFALAHCTHRSSSRNCRSRRITRWSGEVWVVWGAGGGVGGAGRLLFA